MWAMQMSELAPCLGAELVGEDCTVQSVSTDSRAICRGDIFIALVGDTFDGHDYVELAASNGAVAAIVSRGEAYSVPCLKVDDTTAALGHLAALNRRYFSGTLIGVTGSSGKTTVKNMLASIFEGVGATHATAGNFNNEIGVPLTLMGLSAEHEFAVIEMGASAKGDIEYLAGIAEPDVAVLLNAHPAHLQGFGSLEGVAGAKGEIFSSLSDTGVGVINADSEFAPLWRELLGSRRSVSFGLSSAADVNASEVKDCGVLGISFQLCGDWGELPVTLPLVGRHNVNNALAAAAAAIAADVSIADIRTGLGCVRPTPGRLCVGEIASGAVVVDDTYNANPSSVKAAIDALVATPGRHILMLGEMDALGADSAGLHAEVGRYASDKQVDELWLVGGAGAAAKGYVGDAKLFANIDAMPALNNYFGAGDIVLVKGSRSAGMEAVLDGLNSSREVP